MNTEFTYELHHVGYQYRQLGREDQRVIDDLSLQIRSGEVFSIISPSGEGKTTLLKMLGGLLRPQAGEIVFQGENLYQGKPAERLLRQRHIGMTFERGGLFDSLTCEENLAFPLRERNTFTPSEIREKIDHALYEVGLEEVKALHPHELSGGMQKRLGLARALVMTPDVILYDEPTAGLDPITSRSIVQALLAMKAEYSMTTILATSDLALSLQMGDRIGFLYEGNLRFVGTAKEIRTHEDSVIKQFVHGLLEGPLTQND